ncbi:MAG: serine hydrolase [Armatimonadota bacterium]
MTHRLFRNNVGLTYIIASGLVCTSLTVGATLLAGCGGGRSQVTSSPTPTFTDAKVQSAFATLDAQATRAVKEAGVPGMAVVVVYKDKIVYLKGFGVRQKDGTDLVTPDTVFQLASLSKPITATAIAGLVGDGSVSWDDPIRKYLPDFQMDTPSVTQQVTIRDFLSHRSGLPDHTGDELEDMGYSQDQILHQLRYVSTGNRFRSAYAYTNYGFTTAGVAAAKSVGKSYDDFIADRLFRPLGMTSTSTRFADYVASPNHAVGHARENGQWIAKYQRKPDNQAPAGGVNSTARDMAQWLRLLLAGGKIDGRPVIDASALAETQRAQIERPNGPYGLGWNVGNDSQGRPRPNHSGAFSQGAATAVFALPTEGLGIVVLSNGAPIGAPEAVALSFLDVVAEGKMQRDWLTFLEPIFVESTAPEYGKDTDYTKPPAQPTPALTADAYAGTYHSDFFGNIEIAAQSGSLVLKQGPAQTAFPMTHWDGNIFLFQPVGEQAGGLSGVTFTIGANQKAEKILVENLNIYGLGTFTRIPAGS